MMHKELLVLVCVFAIVYSKSSVKSGIRDCFKQECPEDTYACEKLTHVSEDKKHIVAEVHCLDLKGDILKNVTNYEDNPYGSTTDFKGYSYRGAFQITVDNDSDENVPKEGHGFGDSDNKNSEVEDLIHR